MLQPPGSLPTGASGAVPIEGRFDLLRIQMVSQLVQAPRSGDRCMNAITGGLGDDTACTCAMQV